MGFDAPDTEIGKARRKAILAAARTEFLAKGFIKASLRAIAQESQCTVSNLYGYYSSKDALFSAVVEPTRQRFEEIYRELERRDFELVEQGHTMTLDAVLDAYGEMAKPLIDYVIDNRDDMRLLLLQSQGASMGKILESYHKHNLDLHHEFLAERHEPRANYLRQVSPQMQALISSIPLRYMKELSDSQLDKEQAYRDIDVLFRFMTVGYNYFLDLWDEDDALFADASGQGDTDSSAGLGGESNACSSANTGAPRDKAGVLSDLNCQYDKASTTTNKAGKCEAGASANTGGQNSAESSILPRQEGECTTAVPIAIERIKDVPLPCPQKSLHLLTTHEEIP
ncbi:MAG: TetR/AcrR family transcriptional regulator [Actinomycetaceae bacterium]|nr:TetR/AcrR family transcriptional regulator [Actinomycetaceae bacterium]